MNSNSPFKNTRIEFHILQSFPVSCLNRDDVGAPKTAVIGGTTRARVSSQCWKRQVRLSLRNFSATLGHRTKFITHLIAKACVEAGASQEQAHACGSKIEHIFIKKSNAESKKSKKNEDDVESDSSESSSSEKTDTLLFLSPNEVKILAKIFAAKNFNPEEVITQKEADKQAKELAKLIDMPNESIDALDIALFGRMVAQAATLNIEAVASFAHAISTHKSVMKWNFLLPLMTIKKNQVLRIWGA